MKARTDSERNEIVICAFVRNERALQNGLDHTLLFIWSERVPALHGR